MVNKLDLTRLDPFGNNDWSNFYRSDRDQDVEYLFESIKIDASDFDPAKVAICTRRRNASTGITQLLFMLVDDTQVSHIHTKLMRQ